MSIPTLNCEKKEKFFQTFLYVLMCFPSHIQKTNKQTKQNNKNMWIIFTWEFWCRHSYWCIREIPVGRFLRVPRKTPMPEYFPPEFVYFYCCVDWNGKENGIFFSLFKKCSHIRNSINNIKIYQLPLLFWQFNIYAFIIYSYDIWWRYFLFSPLCVHIFSF